MGNCVAKKAMIVENGEYKEPIREAIEPSEKKSGAANCNRENQRNSSKSGTGVRIRVVVTQTELIQIMRNNESKYSSVEQLLSEMKLKRRRKICQLGTSEGPNVGWRPALESIPEEH